VESQQQQREGVVGYQAAHEVFDPGLYNEEDRMVELEDPIAFCLKATKDPDTMYMNKAMKEPDAKQFKEAMIKEVKAHTDNKHWEVINKREVPSGYIPLPAVWAMRRKRRIATREVYKWKSRLNLGGHKMIPGTHYDLGETYAPALSWETIRLFLTLSIIHGWKSRQIDFILAYPQAPIPRPTYMELPRGINFPKGIDRNKHCLKVNKNLYGGKDSGRTWYKYLVKGLIKIGFRKLENNDCVFVRGQTILLVYTDDCLLFWCEEFTESRYLGINMYSIESLFILRNTNESIEVADYL
jgi:hypothetical protein